MNKNESPVQLSVKEIKLKDFKKKATDIFLDNCFFYATRLGDNMIFAYCQKTGQIQINVLESEDGKIVDSVLLTLEMPDALHGTDPKISKIPNHPELLAVSCMVKLPGDKLQTCLFLTVVNVVLRQVHCSSTLDWITQSYHDNGKIEYDWEIKAWTDTLQPIVSYTDKASGLVKTKSPLPWEY